MSKTEKIDQLVARSEYAEARKLSREAGLNHLEEVLGELESFHFGPQSSVESTQELEVLRPFRVRLSCNWTDSKGVIEQWKRQSWDQDGRWGRLELTSDREGVDYYVVINDSEDLEVCPERTVLVEMDRTARVQEIKKKMATCVPPKKFLFVLNHELDLNNCEWSLEKSYAELLPDLNPLDKEARKNYLSVALPESQHDGAQVRVVDFIRFLARKNLTALHVYGHRAEYCPELKDRVDPNPIPKLLESKIESKIESKTPVVRSSNLTLPVGTHHTFLPENLRSEFRGVASQEERLRPYRYCLISENRNEKNYCSEKMFNAILSECLVFYTGCYNLREYLDPRAFVYLELSNFERDANAILNTMTLDLYSQRLVYIRQAKLKILNELSFFPRMNAILCTADRQRSEWLRQEAERVAKLGLANPDSVQKSSSEEKKER